MATENPYDLISVPLLDLPPEEILRRYELVNKYEVQIGKSPQLSAAYRHLEENGYKREDGWVYLELSRPVTPDQVGAEKILQSWRQNFPDGIEILAIQGSYIGGTAHDEKRGVHSWIKPAFDNKRFTVFIRIKPRQLETSS